MSGGIFGGPLSENIQTRYAPGKAAGDEFDRNVQQHTELVLAFTTRMAFGASVDTPAKDIWTAELIARDVRYNVLCSGLANGKILDGRRRTTKLCVIYRQCLTAGYCVTIIGKPLMMKKTTLHPWWASIAPNHMPSFFATIPLWCGIILAQLLLSVWSAGTSSVQLLRTSEQMLI